MCRRCWPRSLGRAVANSFRHGLSIDPLPHLINDPAEIERAAREWRTQRAAEISLLGVVSYQALNRLDLHNFQVAATAFTSSVITTQQLDRFVKASPYLTRLIAQSIKSDGQFRDLMNLFIQLSELPG